MADTENDNSNQVSRRALLTGAVSAAAGSLLGYAIRKPVPVDPAEAVLSELRQDKLVPEKFFSETQDDRGTNSYYDYSKGPEGKPHNVPKEGLIASATHISVYPGGLEEAAREALKGKVPDALKSGVAGINNLNRTPWPMNDEHAVTILKRTDPRVHLEEAYFHRYTKEPLSDEQMKALDKKWRDTMEKEEAKSGHPETLTPPYVRNYVVESASGEMPLQARDVFVYTKEPAKTPLILEFGASADAPHTRLMPLNKHVVFDLSSTAIPKKREFIPGEDTLSDFMKSELQSRNASSIISDMENWQRWNKKPLPVEHLEFRMSAQQATTLGATRFAAWVETNILDTDYEFDKAAAIPDKAVSKEFDYSVSVGKASFAIHKGDWIQQSRAKLLDWMEANAETFRWQKQGIREMREKLKDKSFVDMAVLERARTR